MLPVSSLSSPVYTLTSLPLDLQPLNNNTNFSISYLNKNKTTRLSSACDINDGFTHSDKAFACSKYMFAKKLFHLSGGWLDPLLHKKVTCWSFFRVGASNGQVPEVRFGEDNGSLDEDLGFTLPSGDGIISLGRAGRGDEDTASGRGWQQCPASGNWPFLSEVTTLTAAEAAVIYSSLCEKRTRICICK